MSDARDTWEDQECAPQFKDDWREIAPGSSVFFRNLRARRPLVLKGRRRGKVGAFYSWKNRAHVFHQCAGEERCARVLELLPTVHAFVGRPEEIKFKRSDTGRLQRYTPSFIVEYGDDTVRIQYCRLDTVRPERPTALNDKRGWQRWNAAEANRATFRQVATAYSRAGLTWNLITDEDLVAAADPDTVDEIIANGGRPMTPTQRTRLVEYLRQSPHGVPLQACEDLIGDSDFPRGTILAQIPNRLISIDLKLPIGPSTLVRPTDKALGRSRIGESHPP